MIVLFCSRIICFALFPVIVIPSSCQNVPEQGTDTATNHANVSGQRTENIKVLNFATFHMGQTTDSYKSPYDAYTDEHRREIKELCRRIAGFNPTVICVEVPPPYQQELLADYLQYQQDTLVETRFVGEVPLVAYEVGRLCNVEKIYGIDHPMEYDYLGAQALADSLQPAAYVDYLKVLEDWRKENERLLEEAHIIEVMKFMNAPSTLDFLQVINADIFTHVNTEGNFEGADVAADYYRRNLRMYANFNRLDLQEDDRVFLLMGGSHTAFFHNFIARSPKYQTVDALKYLE